MQDLINAVATKLGIINENLAGVKEQIASGTLEGAIRDCKQLEHSAYSLLRLLQDLEALREASEEQLSDRLFEMQVFTR